MISTPPLHPHDASDAVSTPFAVFRDVLAANINQPRPLGTFPPVSDFRNRPHDNRGLATCLLRAFLAHTTSAATCSAYVYAFPGASELKQHGQIIPYRSEGLLLADVTITFAGGVVYGVCPITRQATIVDDRPGYGQAYSQATTRFYKASSVSFNDQYNEGIIKSLRESTESAVTEVQTLTVSATSGQYRLVFDGEETADIDYDDNAAAIETAFEALSNVGSGNGTIGSTGPFTITFTGDLSAQEQPLVTVVPGTTPYAGGTVTVARTTKGESPEMMMMVDMLKHQSLFIEPYALSAGSRVIFAAAPWQR